MYVWCHLPTIFNRRVALRLAGLVTLCVALTTTLLFTNVSHAATGVNQTLSFQGRLQSTGGAVVPDGYYNIQFSIYQDGDGTAAHNSSPSGSNQTPKWTETYVNNGGTSGVQVTNGYFSVNLGSKNAFGANVDWNQDTLFLSMNVAGSSASCTTFGSGGCTADGEMLPMKRITSTPYSLNSGQLGGKTASQFLQLAQGVQADASTNTSSIFVNKTGTGNLVQLQSSGADVFSVSSSGDLTFGGTANHALSIDTSSANNAGGSLTISSGSGGTGAGTTGGNLNLQGGAAGGTNGIGGSVNIDAGAAAGTGLHANVAIGTANAGTIQIGGTNLSSDQTITIGGQNTGGAKQDVTVGSGAGAAGGKTTIQSKDSTNITTNGIQRATFDTSGNLFLGNGAVSTSPSAFTIQGTASSTAGVSGSALTVQGGNATVGNANGGNLTISGGAGSGTGVSGLVVINTPTFSTTSADSGCFTSGAIVAASCTISSSSVDSTSAIIVGFSTSGQTASMPDPTNRTAGRIVYITAANGSSDFTLSLNGGGIGNLTSMRQNTSATLIWNGNDWTVAGASNSTTLQSAYDNTLQSAGGAELIVSNGSNANGLTIRDSSTNPVNGTLLEVQNSSAATLFSVNSNIPEYATDAGAETAGSSATTFPGGTWGVAGSGGSISRYATPGNYVATGLASVQVNSTTANTGAYDKLTSALTPGMTYNVSLSVRLDSTSAPMNDLAVYYLADGSVPSNTCTSGITVQVSAWKKINCSFTAPASGEVPGNVIAVGQATNSGAHKFYIDNLSVTIAAGSNYATDGSVRDNTNFGTNWVTTGAGSTVTRNTLDGYDASDSAQTAVTTGANTGIRNKLSINPLTGSIYRVSAYAKLNSGTALNDFKIRYSATGATDTNAANYVDCVDYNTQVVGSGWTQITCFINTDSTTPTTPYAYFVQTASGARNFSVDAFSMTLYSNTTSNVQVGGGANGGPTTLLTLDKAAAAPTAENNDSLLGSMYYDTTLGKIQCYQAAGWGSCGSAPDNIITISPEFTNAVMHGAGVGTMTSDLCSSTLGINDGTGSQPTICGANETRNFYKWTSPQSSAQAYSIFVTYQLPSTFKTFTSGSTSLLGRTDSSNSSVSYQVYRSTAASGLSLCGGTVSVSSGSVSTWQTGAAAGAADPSTCGFSPGDSIVFKITASAQSNANAYISNLGFTFSNK